MDDSKLKLREVPDTLKISEGSVFTILYESLGMRKLFSKWVPHLLKTDQKQLGVKDSERGLELFKQGEKDFLHRHVTMDGTSIHHYTPKTKRSSAVWTTADESRPKHGILFIVYLERGKTINSDYYIPSELAEG